MELLKRILKKIFFLPPLISILIALPSFALVICVLIFGEKNTVLSYLAYVASAYAVIIVTIDFLDIVRAVRQGVNRFPLIQKVVNHPIGCRYFQDVSFQTKVSLYIGLSINLVYAAIKLGSGIYFQSSWFISLAGYYILLAVMRFFLLRHVNQNTIGQNLVSEYRRYRLCGILLLLMNQALAVIVVFMVRQNRGYDYPGMLIYIMAIYAFYTVTTAIINLVKFRKHGSPVLSAAKVINLTAALVSILSLETAMLTQFGTTDTPAFRKLMTGACGAGVCLIVFGMAVFMIIGSSKQLKKWKSGVAFLEYQPHGRKGKLHDGRK